MCSDTVCWCLCLENLFYSLPLRFWVNIIKNPQFVFDMEKTKNVDGCLSVIAQAFMDSFSLSENQLGKVKHHLFFFFFFAKTVRDGSIPPWLCFIMFQYAPTNKLLYAKDIPKFKQEVKSYYKQVRDQPSITASEFKDFLDEASQVRCISGQNQTEVVRWRRRSEPSCACCHFRNMKTSSTRLQPSKRFTNSSNSISQRSVVFSVSTQSSQALPAFMLLKCDLDTICCGNTMFFFGLQISFCFFSSD